MDEGIRAKLGDLRLKPKFADEPGTIYNGMRPESDRLTAERQLDGLIDFLISEPGESPTRSKVLAAISKVLKSFPGSDTEDCDRMCDYMREILDILGIESSGGLLIRWRYGWLLGTLLLMSPNARR